MDSTEYKPISVRDWIITLIILAVPFVNVIMLIVWAVNESTHPSKRSYAKATLILCGIAVGIGFLAALIMPLYVHSLK
jgi:hypothetical protein